MTLDAEPAAHMAMCGFLLFDTTDATGRVVRALRAERLLGWVVQDAALADAVGEISASIAVDDGHRVIVTTPAGIDRGDRVIDVAERLRRSLAAGVVIARASTELARTVPPAVEQRASERFAVAPAPRRVYLLRRSMVHSVSDRDLAAALGVGSVVIEHDEGRIIVADPIRPPYWPRRARPVVGLITMQDHLGVVMSMVDSPRWQMPLAIEWTPPTVGLVTHGASAGPASVRARQTTVERQVQPLVWEAPAGTEVMVHRALADYGLGAAEANDLLALAAERLDDSTLDRVAEILHLPRVMVAIARGQELGDLEGRQLAAPTRWSSIAGGVRRWVLDDLDGTLEVQLEGRVGRARRTITAIAGVLLLVCGLGELWLSGLVLPNPDGDPANAVHLAFAALLLGLGVWQVTNVLRAVRIRRAASTDARPMR